MKAKSGAGVGAGKAKLNNRAKIGIALVAIAFGIYLVFTLYLPSLSVPVVVRIICVSCAVIGTGYCLWAVNSKKREKTSFGEMLLWCALALGLLMSLPILFLCMITVAQMF